MKEKISDLLELPLPHRLGILLGSVFIIVLVYWFAFFRSVAHELSQIREAIDGPNGLVVQIAQNEAIVENLPLYLAEVNKLDVELKKALAQLPDRRQTDQLLARISDKAGDAGLEIRLFKPLPDEKKDFYAAVPVHIEVRGSYHQVATFFDEVGRLDRIVNLANVSMDNPEVNKDAAVLKTSVIATAFRFLDESERPKAEEEKRGKSTRARKRQEAAGKDIL